MQFGEKENLRYIRQDLKNYLCTKPQKDLEFADAGSVDMLLIEQYLNLKS